MTRTKKIILSTFISLILLCNLTFNVNAAGCAHNNSSVGPWTGNIISSQSTHAVILGYYTNGTPITVTCTVVKQHKLHLTICDSCKQVVGTSQVIFSESHTIKH